MNSILGVFLSAALALGSPPVPERFEDIETRMQDLASQRHYAALAATAERAYARRDLTPAQRRSMAFFAVRGLHGVFTESGLVKHLCHAQRLLKRVEHEVGIGDDALTVDRLRRATARHIETSGVREPCPPTARRPSQVAIAETTPTSATQVSQVGTAEAGPPSSSTPPASREDASPTTKSSDDLLAVHRVNATAGLQSNLSHAPAKPARAATSAPAPSTTFADAPRRDPRLTRAGIALTSVGVLAAAGFGVSLEYRSRADDTIRAIKRSADDDVTQGEYDRAAVLNSHYRGLTVVAGITGALAVTGLVTGVALLAIKPRRTTTALAPWATPTGAGFTIRGRF